MRLLHSFFLLKFHNTLLGYEGIRLKHLVSLSTTLCKIYVLLGQSQNTMVLSLCLLKNALSLLDIIIDC